MLSIHPCRSQISDRFPVASFAIQVPDTRYFEVACATDPRLFHVDWQRHRTHSNFYSSRERGLERAHRGQTAWILPPEQLRRFAGARRVFFALGSYGAPDGRQAEFSISPFALDQVPSISLAPDFTGRSLDRSRLRGGAPDIAYGNPTGQVLRWGGDDVLEATRSSEEPRSGEYDDGHSPELWQGDESSAFAVPAGADTAGDQAAYDAGISREGGSDDGPHASGSSADAFSSDAPGASDATEVDTAGWRDGQDYGSPALGYGDGGSGTDDDPDLDAVDLGLDGYEDAAELRGSRGLAEEEERGDGLYEAAAFADEDGGAYGEDGFEDAAALYGSVAYAPGGIDGGFEPDGRADARTAGSAGGSLGSPAGTPDTSAGSTTGTAPAKAEPGVGEGRDPEYRESVPDEEPLPVGRASRALAVTALDIPEKVRLLRVVAVAESGRDGYTAINADREYNDPNHPAYHSYHIGLSWGFIQFTQRSGALGRVLQATKRREDALPDLAAEHRFPGLFGPHWEELLRVTSASDAEARVAPVGGSPLWESAWTTRFRAAGAVPHVTYAQNEIAITDYVDPVLNVAQWLDFNTPRALAMLVDRCIHMGVGGGLSWTLRAVGPIQTQGDRDAALRALGHADLRAFQQTLAPRLSVDGRWGPKTHAAMTSALRALGAASPVTVPTRDLMLQRMVEAARSHRFARRVTALHTNHDDFSDDVTYALA